MKKIFVLLSVVGLAGCGSDLQMREDEKVAVPSSIRDVWRVEFKTCDGTHLDVQPLESYRIDRGHFVRVIKLSETDTQLCKQALIYNKLVRSSEHTTSGSYVEHADLSADQQKITCWKKVSGKISAQPASEQVQDFGPEELALSLGAHKDGAVTVDLKNSQDCPKGTLVLGLIRK